MRFICSESQVQVYREQGFLVIEDFLDASELAAWRAALDEALERRGPQRFPGAEVADDRADDAYYRQVFDQRVNLWKDCPALRDCVLDERLGRLAADLAGVDRIRLWHDQALIKEAWANPTNWHQDLPYWSFDSPRACSLWVALDDTTLQNGCLYFLPGSQRTERREKQDLSRSMGDVFALFPERRLEEARATPLRAGSCTVHNALTLHAAGPNMTPRRRRAMTCAFLPDGVPFNGQQNVLPADYFRSLRVGDLLQSDAHNPLLFDRAATSGASRAS